MGVVTYMVKGRTLECVTERHDPGRSLFDPSDHSVPVPSLRGLTAYYVDGREVTAAEVAELLGIDVPTLERVNGLCDPTSNPDGDALI
jgi:hypothetical protein